MTNWSSQQQAVFDAALTPAHLVVEALAGTGKTTTAVECLRVLKAAAPASRVLMCAFNKAIAVTLQSRVPAGVDVSTLHSAGLKMLRGRTINADAGRDALLADLRGRFALGASARVPREESAFALRLLGLAKATLVSTSADLVALADAHELTVPLRRDECVAAVQARLAVKDAQEIDFDDMVWLPVVTAPPAAFRKPKYDVVIVDEAQDLSPVQLRLVRLLGRRIIAIGDRHQSIYGFRGADSQAIPRLISELEATVLPLSVTYRCPRSVVSEAQAYVPAFTAADDAPEGTVIEAEDTAMLGRAVPGDMVVSRANAPLVKYCLAWLARGQRAEIRGRDMSASLKALADKLDWRVADAIGTWERAEVARLNAEQRETAVETAHDKADCMRALRDGVNDPRDIPQAIDAIFAEGRGGIVLTSTHRAKGLESEVVWMIADTYGKRDTQEERNLSYVAITRSLRELVYVTKAADAA